MPTHAPAERLTKLLEVFDHHPDTQQWMADHEDLRGQVEAARADCAANPHETMKRVDAIAVMWDIWYPAMRCPPQAVILHHRFCRPAVLRILRGLDPGSLGAALRHCARRTLSGRATPDDVGYMCQDGWAELLFFARDHLPFLAAATPVDRCRRFAEVARRPTRNHIRRTRPEAMGCRDPASFGLSPDEEASLNEFLARQATMERPQSGFSPEEQRLHRLAYVYDAEEVARQLGVTEGRVRKMLIALENKFRSLPD